MSATQTQTDIPRSHLSRNLFLGEILLKYLSKYLNLFSSAEKWEGLKDF